MAWGKPEIKKVPYYQPIESLLAGWKWKYFSGSESCIPLITKQKISYDRLAPGETPPRPQLTLKELKSKQEIETKNKQSEDLRAQPTKKAEEAKNKDKLKAQEKSPEGEEVDKLPEFDLQDVATGMDAMGWTVSAKLVRRWFSSPALIIPKGDEELGRPIDGTTITLEWALKFRGVKPQYNKLVNNDIYNKKAVAIIKNKVESQIKRMLVPMSGVSGFSTASSIVDLQKFHNEWQFQFSLVTASDTTTKHFFTTKNFLEVTDLTGSLANFGLYAAIGIVEVVAGDKYYDYDNANKTKTWCVEPTVRLTHVYVYLRDIYEFNNEQNLGHWNKTGVIVTIPDGLKMIQGPIFLSDGGEHPVDTRKGFGKLKEKNIYWPVRNSSYNNWRKQHNRGGDFVIFSKPVLVKLKEPIEFKTGKICAASEKL